MGIYSLLSVWLSASDVSIRVQLFRVCVSFPWCLWWEVWDNCIDSWSLPSFLFYSTDRSKAVVSLLVLLFVALWFILRGDLFYVLPCVILFLCFSVLLSLRLPRLGRRELFLVLLVRLFDLYLFGFVSFLFLLVSGKGCGLCLWHSQDFSLTFFLIELGAFMRTEILCVTVLRVASGPRCEVG